MAGRGGDRGIGFGGCRPAGARPGTAADTRDNDEQATVFPRYGQFDGFVDDFFGGTDEAEHGEGREKERADVPTVDVDIRPRRAGPGVAVQAVSSKGNRAMKTVAVAALLLVAGCSPNSADTGSSTEASDAGATTTETTNTETMAPSAEAMATGPDAVTSADMGSAKTVEDPGEPVATTSGKPGKP